MAMCFSGHKFPGNGFCVYFVHLLLLKKTGLVLLKVKLHHMEIFKSF